jgi:hypothetical protein
MRYWTWGEIKAKIEAECDLEDEDFVRSGELLSYANEAIDEAEAEIHGLYEDYFLTRKEINVVSGDKLLSINAEMPDIYADKIRRIIYNSGGNTYAVSRLKDWKKFEQKALAENNTSTDLYQYMLINTTPGSPQIMWTPEIRESGKVMVWYLRNANRLSVDADICDIPEFVNFVIAFLKVKVMGKEGHPGYQDAVMELEKQRAQMTSTLQARVPDADNELEMDASYYEEHN